MLRSEKPTWNKQHIIIRYVPILIFVSGLSVPIIPRLIHPLFRSEDIIYSSTFKDVFLSNDYSSIFLIGYVGLPLYVLSFISFYHLRSVKDKNDTFHKRTAGILGSLAVTYVLGFIINLPMKSAYGANIGLGLYPFYCIFLTPAGYLLGKIIWFAVDKVINR